MIVVISSAPKRLGWGEEQILSIEIENKKIPVPVQ
jgi:hypothetical protein